jgi:trimeric autotransporter adhesin
MADYSKTTNFAAKDSLPTGDPNKVAKGSEVDTEYDNISTAIATKANKIASATNNRIVTMDASGDIKDSTIATDGAGTITATLTGNVTGNVTGNLTGDILDTNGNEALTITTTASAVNEVTLTNAATGNAPSLSATGDDTNIDLELTSKGTGNVTVNGTPVYGLVVLDTPISLISNTSTSATAQTAVDITAHTTGVATKAILGVHITGSGAVQTKVFVGEGDETLADPTHLAAVADTGSGGFAGSSQVTTNLASGEIFDYSVTQSGVPTSRTVSIYLVGYYV